MIVNRDFILADNNIFSLWLLVFNLLFLTQVKYNYPAFNMSLFNENSLFQTQAQTYLKHKPSNYINTALRKRQSKHFTPQQLHISDSEHMKFLH
jgi:hypothetical protein